MDGRKHTLVLPLAALLLLSFTGAITSPIGTAAPDLSGAHGHVNDLADELLRPSQGPSFGMQTEGNETSDPATEDATEVPTVTVRLEAMKKTFDVMGVPTEAWTFNGYVPGPIIRVTEGTKIEATVVNSLDQAHSLHTHFRSYAYASDGSSDTAPLPVVPHQHNMLPVNQNPIGPYEPRADRDVADPGQSYTYTFFADTPGTFLYHCHVFLAQEHISRGLFGLFVVYPKDWTWEELPVDPMNGNTKARVTDPQGNTYFEDVVMISELSVAQAPSAGVPIPGVPSYPTEVPTTGFLPASTGKIHLANWRAWNDPYIVGPVQPNERVIIRVANIGDELHSWHTHSHWFDVLDKISREKKPLYTTDTLLIGPGESFETVLTAGPAGVWFLHDHIVPEAYTGMVPWIKIEGDPVPNTPPTATIDSPTDGAFVAGTVLFQGRADDFQGREMVQRVEVRVDDGAWETVPGILAWRFVWDSTLVPDGVHEIAFRSFDGRDHSPEAAMGVRVLNDFASLGNALGGATAATGSSSKVSEESPAGGLLLGVVVLAATAMLLVGRRKIG